MFLENLRNTWLCLSKLLFQPKVLFVLAFIEKLAWENEMTNSASVFSLQTEVLKLVSFDLSRREHYDRERLSKNC